MARPATVPSLILCLMCAGSTIAQYFPQGGGGPEIVHWNINSYHPVMPLRCNVTDEFFDPENATDGNATPQAEVYSSIEDCHGVCRKIKFKNQNGNTTSIKFDCMKYEQHHPAVIQHVQSHAMPFPCHLNDNDDITHVACCNNYDFCNNDFTDQHYINVAEQHAISATNAIIIVLVSLGIPVFTLFGIAACVYVSQQKRRGEIKKMFRFKQLPRNGMLAHEYDGTGCANEPSGKPEALEKAEEEEDAILRNMQLIGLSDDDESAFSARPRYSPRLLNKCPFDDMH